MSIKQKITQYLDFKGIKKTDFYKITEFSNGFLDSGENIGTNNLKTVIEKFPDLNIDWLVLGVGDMIKEVEKDNLLNVRYIIFFEYLKEFEVDKLSDNEYIFSKRITLEPGLQAIEPNRISECWKDIVKDGIGIQKDLYASKHTSGMLFILNGGSKEALQYQMRHSSVAETENYIKTIVPTDMSRKFAEQFSFGLKFK